MDTPVVFPPPYATRCETEFERFSKQIFCTLNLCSKSFVKQFHPIVNARPEGDMPTLILLLVVPFLFESPVQHVEDKAYVVFYFGATSCGPCSRPEMVKSVNLIKSEFAQVHSDYATKLVMVVMDQDIAEGITYLEKYDSWDEVSIGSHYQNELVRHHLNTQEMPGVPHVLVFEDEYEEAKYGTSILKERQLVAALLGMEAIVTWTDSGFPLEKP